MVVDARATVEYFATVWTTEPGPAVKDLVIGKAQWFSGVEGDFGVQEIGKQAEGCRRDGRLHTPQALWNRGKGVSETTFWHRMPPLDRVDLEADGAASRSKVAGPRCPK